MSSVQYLREFVTERLTAAAEEIFRVFEQTIVEYEEEIDRQRRLLDIVWKPEIKLHRIDFKVVSSNVNASPEFPQQHVLKEDANTDQQLCNQERNSSLDQEDPDPPQFKEEQEELCTSQEREQLVLKQETDNVMLITTYEESDHSEPEPMSDHQLLSHSSPVAESQDQKASKRVDSGSTRNAEPKPKRKRRKNTRHSNTKTGKRSIKCDTCGKDFKSNCFLKSHLRVHTGEKPYTCNTCGTRFTHLSTLKAHLRIHTGEKPYLCSTCGKRFKQVSTLKSHIRTHTGEKPYPCDTCGTRFLHLSTLYCHLRIHTGEKPYLCNTCGKRFRGLSGLKYHIKVHTDQKSYVCITCGKRFKRKSTLKSHIRTHTGEKP